MATINYRLADGTDQIVDVPEGWTLMEGAIKNGLRGILADCGGACACATCQVVIPQDWLARLTPAAADETEMMEFAADPQPGSRLSCQIPVGAAMDGMVVQLPKTQLL
ncbi:2Fe-2S iron-sulfur cluster-binding protein [Novosphingobium rosa]|uniref:2Fe-2S iron-sulfur cluster-binding protein n=1 Tax=Novosphingobium rosa TaxID=76978 RepID=UPI000831FA4C|nr:2Fe-2S iron-sulfur cluster-binding protein [Novosphingobium rosa]